MAKVRKHFRGQIRELICLFSYYVFSITISKSLAESFVCGLLLE